MASNNYGCTTEHIKSPNSSPIPSYVAPNPLDLDNYTETAGRPIWRGLAPPNIYTPREIVRPIMHGPRERPVQLKL